MSHCIHRGLELTRRRRSIPCAGRPSHQHRITHSDFQEDNTAYVPIIFGVAEDDGASVGSYSKTCTTEAECLEQNLYISPYYSQDAIDSGLFPLYDTGNITADSVNVSVRIDTDLVWRCAGEATVYAGAESGAVPAAYFYESVSYTTSGVYCLVTPRNPTR